MLIKDDVLPFYKADFLTPSNQSPNVHFKTDKKRTSHQRWQTKKPSRGARQKQPRSLPESKPTFDGRSQSGLWGL
jgi:hypothetical protein